MKIKSLVMFCAAALVMTACSKEGTQGVEPGVPEGVKTTVKITLSQSKVHGRAHFGNLVPTPQETTVNTANLYIFNSAKVLEAVVPFGSGETSKTFETTTGTKYFYVTANMASPVAEIGITSVSNILSIENGVSNIGDPTVANNFWMTSLGTTSDMLVSATQDEVESGIKNNVKLQVGRAVAKVGVYFNPSTQVGGTLSDVTYKIHNNPNMMRLLPSWTGTHLNTPFYADAVPVSLGNYFSNTSYLGTGLDGGNTYHAEPSYMMENSNEVPRQGNATFAMIKGVFTPAMVYDKDGANGVAGTKGNEFFRIKRADGTYTDKYYFEAPSLSEVNKDGGVSYVNYPNGECYYAMWLKDDSQDNTIDKYTINRNTYWSITITSVNGAGASTEGDVTPDPDEELEADTWMKATIQVMDWTPVSQQGGI